MIPYEQALLHILERVEPLAAERLPLELARGRALVESIHADRALPPFDNSQMDGYALRSADLARASANAPVRMRIGQRVPAGAPAGPLSAGECARVLTGAPVPPGADAVVMQEDVRVEGEQAIFSEPTESGSYVRRSGEDIRPNELAVSLGRRLGASELALLASLGHSHVRVHRRPRVALISTGDELVELGQRSPPADRIVDSNALALGIRLHELGAEPVQLGLVGDQRDAMRERFRAARGCEVVISSAGVSVGDKDYVKEILRDLGAELHLEKVAIRPGKPLVFATAAGALYFGLPGNPVSSRVTFEVFVRPALCKLMGLSPQEQRMPAVLARSISKPQGLTVFARVKLHLETHRLVATPLPKQNSGYLTSLVGADGLAVLPTGTEEVVEGTEVEVIPLEGRN
jgi:molybdopterin molybdotransferase